MVSKAQGRLHKMHNRDSKWNVTGLDRAWVHPVATTVKEIAKGPRDRNVGETEGWYINPV